MHTVAQYSWTRHQPLQTVYIIRICTVDGQVVGVLAPRNVYLGVEQVWTGAGAPPIDKGSRTLSREEHRPWPTSLQCIMAQLGSGGGTVGEPGSRCAVLGRKAMSKGEAAHSRALARERRTQRPGRRPGQRRPAPERLLVGPTRPRPGRRARGRRLCHRRR